MSETFEKSLEDDIREAMAQHTPEDAAELAPVAEEVAETEAGRDRGDDGRFKSKEEPVELAEPVAELVAEGPVIPDALGVPPTYAKRAIKESWATLPTEVRQELHDREKEIHQQFTRFDEERVFGKKAKEVMAPFEGFIRSLGAEPIQAIDYLVKTDYALRTAPVEQRKALFLKAAKDYGIDLGQEPLYSDQQQVPAVDPRFETLQQQVNHLESERKSAIRDQQEREQQDISRQIEAFAARPENVYYERVSPMMAVLLQSGQAQTLEEAYDKAVYADPDLRALQLAAQSEAGERKRKQEAAAKASAARQASVSVTGAPGNSAMPPRPSGTSTGTVEDDIRAAIAEVGGRI